MQPERPAGRAGRRWRGRMSGRDGPGIPELEADEDVAPRPEEEIADVARAEPDVEPHGGPAT
ncbi:hypothetical protein GCM10023225_19780 [Kineococcus glutinatus]|uniref:Uncharacterized protein n=1 Tax=Kineococcus glutinatus TaxID=1070872 RepID=A0ABP9HVU2_9ACTN